MRSWTKTCALSVSRQVLLGVVVVSHFVFSPVVVLNPIIRFSVLRTLSLCGSRESRSRPVTAPTKRMRVFTTVHAGYQSSRHHSSLTPVVLITPSLAHPLQLLLARPTDSDHVHVLAEARSSLSRRRAPLQPDPVRPSPCEGHQGLAVPTLARQVPDQLDLRVADR